MKREYRVLFVVALGALLSVFPFLSSPRALGGGSDPVVDVQFSAPVAADFRRAENTLDDVFAASCRVNVSGARGSGTFNGVKDGLAYISTNYHVVSNQKNATVDFWTNGVKQTLAGRVAWRAYDANLPADFAFKKTLKNKLAGDAEKY